MRGAYVIAELNHQFSEMANSNQLIAIIKPRFIHDSRDTQRAANDGVTGLTVVEGMAYTLAGISSNSLRMYDKIRFPAIAVLGETDSAAKSAMILVHLLLPRL